MGQIILIMYRNTYICKKHTYIYREKERDSRSTTPGGRYVKDRDVFGRLAPQMALPAHAHGNLSNNRWMIGIATGVCTSVLTPSTREACIPEDTPHKITKRWSAPRHKNRAHARQQVGNEGTQNKQKTETRHPDPHPPAIRKSRGNPV